jgi:hypothetical protein
MKISGITTQRLEPTKLVVEVRYEDHSGEAIHIPCDERGLVERESFISLLYVLAHMLKMRDAA